MQYKIYLIAFFCTFGFYNGVWASQKQMIQVQLILGSEWTNSPDQRDRDEWGRFGIAFNDKDTKVISIERAIVSVNQAKNVNAVNWCSMPPLCIQNSGAHIDAEQLKKWGIHQDFINASGGGFAYKFPTMLPKGFFIDQQGNVKKDMILNFTVGNDEYEAQLTVMNPKKIKVGIVQLVKNVMTSMVTAKAEKNIEKADSDNNDVKQQTSYVHDRQKNGLPGIYGGALAIVVSLVWLIYVKSV